VTFRLPAEHARDLVRKARARGVSPGTLARAVVLDRLEGKDDETREELQELRAQVGELTEGLSRLRAEFALAVETLLSFAGKVSRDKARAWAQDHLGDAP
jgi:hypothetical protein